MKKNILHLMLLFIFISSDLTAQNFEIGPELGYGKIGMYILNQPTYLKLPDELNLGYYRLGLISYFSPDSSIFSIKTGILYSQILSEYSAESISKLKILQLPIGCDIKFGKVIYLVVGGGFYINYLLSSKVVGYDFPDFQIGLNTNVGFGYAISRTWSCDLKFLLGYDLTELYTTYSYSPIGGADKEYIQSVNALLCLTLKYKIIKKEPKKTYLK
jgi:hypothetical protein